MVQSKPQPETEQSLWRLTPQDFLTLALLVHLFVVVLVLTSNLSPSDSQLRILRLIQPYARTLNLDLGEPYYLTHASIDDVDHRIEILPGGADEQDESAWLLMTSSSPRGGERYQRYKRFASAMSFFAEREEVTARFASAVANHWVNHRQEEPKQVRARRHMLQSREVITDGRPEERDPDSALYFQEYYRAEVIVINGMVSIVKRESSAREARPQGVTPSTESSTGQ